MNSATRRTHNNGQTTAAFPRRRSPSVRSAFTLVELLLATALSAVLLVVVFTAIEVQLRAFDNAVRKTDRDRLALVLLRRIAADLHGALGPANTEQSASTENDTESEDSTNSLAEEMSSALATTTDLTGSGPIVLYGETDQLWIDVLRAVPNTSSTAETVSDAATWLADTPMPEQSGIRTIVYYLVTAEESTAVIDSTDEQSPTGGLVRREWIEPVALYARELGLLDQLDTSVPPLAPQVIGLEFRYHDGNEWCDEWDSSATGALPCAIEITLMFPPDKTNGHSAIQAATPSAAWGTDDEDAFAYRLVVSLGSETSNSTSAESTGTESDDETAEDADTQAADTAGMEEEP